MVYYKECIILLFIEVNFRNNLYFLLLKVFRNLAMAYNALSAKSRRITLLPLVLAAPSKGNEPLVV